MCRGKAREALAMAEQFLSLSDRSSYESGRVVGHRLRGMAFLGLGDAALARRDAERALALYVPERDAAGTFIFGQDVRVHSGALLSVCLFCLGDVETALRTASETLRAADEMRHPHSTVIALAYVVWVLGFCGAHSHVASFAKRIIDISERHALGMFRPTGEAMLAWSFGELGNIPEASQSLRHAVATFEAADYRITLAGYLALLGEFARQAGNLIDAAGYSQRAVSIVASHSDRWLEPEVRRLAALIARDRHPGHPGQAEAQLREAIACSKRLGAPVFEFRAARSLRELLGAQPDPELDESLRQLARYEDLTAIVAKYF